MPQLSRLRVARPSCHVRETEAGVRDKDLLGAPVGRGEGSLDHPPTLMFLALPSIPWAGSAQLCLRDHCSSSCSLGSPLLSGVPQGQESQDRLQRVISGLLVWVSAEGAGLEVVPDGA